MPHAYELFNGGTKGLKFAYDDLGRVIADTTQAVTLSMCGEQVSLEGMECNPTAWGDVISTTAYSYDAVGNRTDNGGAHAPGNRVTTFGCETFAHDDNGNITSRVCAGDTTLYQWRKDNKLVNVINGGSTYTFRYDAAGRLIRMDLNSTPQRYFLWQGGNLLAELNASGAVVLEYSYYPGLDNPHAVKKGSTLYYAHRDHRGNVVALTDAVSKTVKRHYTYDTWGTLGAAGDLDGFNDTDRARWKGALWFDEIGLYYMRARWYDPTLGRFVSEDPIGLEGGINPYAFAASDPVNHADPTGLRMCRAFGKAIIENGRVVEFIPTTPWVCDPLENDQVEGGPRGGPNGPDPCRDLKFALMTQGIIDGLAFFPLVRGGWALSRGTYLAIKGGAQLGVVGLKETLARTIVPQSRVTVGHVVEGLGAPGIIRAERAVAQGTLRSAGGNVALGALGVGALRELREEGT